MIDIKNLKKVYDMGKVKVVALKEVSFKVKEGEFVALMGPSGSGKSTLLHQLGLLDDPTGGQIMIDSINILDLSDKQKTLFRLNKLGYVFQDYALFPNMNISKNIGYGLRARKIEGQSSTARRKSATRTSHRSVATFSML